MEKFTSRWLWVVNTCGSREFSRSACRMHDFGGSRIEADGKNWAKAGRGQFYLAVHRPADEDGLQVVFGRREPAGLREVCLMVGNGLDIVTNRKAAKYTKSELVRRVLWSVATPLFRFSPRICFGWRCFLLRLFGASVGKNVHIYNSVVIYMPWNLHIGDWSSIGEHAYIYNLGNISIGDKCTISHRAHLCAGTHDFTAPALPLLKPPIVVHDQAWVCADAFVGPGVVVGEGAVVGARAVITKDVPAWTVVAGNPAQVVKKRIIVDHEG